MSIYADMMELEALIDSCADEETGEITDADYEAYEELKKELSTNGLERLAKVRANKLALADGIKAELDRLAKAKKRAEQATAWIEKYMMSIYEISPKDKKGKVIAGTFTVGTRKSTVVEVDESVFSDPTGRFTKTEIITKVDKNALKDALKTEHIPGAILIERQNLSVK